LENTGRERTKTAFWPDGAVNSFGLENPQFRAIPGVNIGSGEYLSR
jgi:hypothetical protein